MTAKQMFKVLEGKLLLESKTYLFLDHVQLITVCEKATNFLLRL